MLRFQPQGREQILLPAHQTRFQNTAGKIHDIKFVLNLFLFTMQFAANTKEERDSWITAIGGTVGKILVY